MSEKLCGGMYCFYKNCKNTFYKSGDSIKYFRFPKDNNRCVTWIKACGKEELLMNDAPFNSGGYYKKYRICSVHFEDYMYNNPFEKTRLLPTAEPIRFIEPASDPEPPVLPVIVNTQTVKTYEKRRRSSSRSDDEEDDRFTDSPKLMKFNHPTVSSPIVATGSSLNDSEITLPLPDGNQWIAPSYAYMSSDLEEDSEEDHAGMRISSEALLRKKCKMLSSRIVNLKKKLKQSRSKIYKTNKKKTSFSTRAILNNILMSKSRSVQVFVNMQLFRKQGGHIWSKEEQQLALSIYFKSPTAYRFMLNTLKFTLPSTIAIKKWLNVSNLGTGIDPVVFNQLSLKARSMTKREKMCVVMFGEVKLTKQLEFNQSCDVVEGFHDLGSLGRNTELADTALVFLIRGLLVDWKTPLCYFVSAGRVGNIFLEKIIRHVIRALKNLSFNPVVLTCDQELNNRSALCFLGATKVAPVIEIEKLKLFTCFDANQLLNSLALNFMNAKLQFYVDKHFVACMDIIQSLQIQEGGNSTSYTLKKTATELFSEYMAGTIKAARESGKLDSATSVDTQMFVENISSIYKLLKTRNINDSDPSNLFSTFQTEKMLKDTIEYFQSIDVFEGTKVRNVRCLNQFEWTLRSVLLLRHYLKEQGVDDLIPEFLSKDPLDKLISNIRSSIQPGSSPTVRRCRISMQNSMTINLKNSLNSRNSASENEIVKKKVNKSKKVVLKAEPEEKKEAFKAESMNEEPNEVVVKQEPEEVVLKEEPEEVVLKNEPEEVVLKEELEEMVFKEEPLIMDLNPTVRLETCSSVCVAGYLVYKVENQFHCRLCSINLTEDAKDMVNKSENLLLCQEHSSGGNITFLKKPSRTFVNIVSYLLRQFSKSFSKHKCDRNITKIIEKDLKRSLEAYPNWLGDDNQECYFHKLYIISLLTKMEIVQHLKKESEKITISKDKPTHRDKAPRKLYVYNKK